MDLVKKYEIGKHLDNLHRRLGDEAFKRTSIYFEDLLGPLDVDVAPILAFQAEMRKRDRGMEKRQAEVVHTVAKNKQWLLRQFIQGKTVVYLAKKLDIDPGPLYYHVKKDPDLHNVYHMMRYRRGYVAKNTAARIWEMLDEGHSLATIASRLHISRDRVKYQRDKRRKMGLVK